MRTQQTKPEEQSKIKPGDAIADFGLVGRSGNSGSSEPGRRLHDHISLAILLAATAQVVGEVSKVYQVVRQAVEGGGEIDFLAAARAFDGLPAWQRARILDVATERATTHK